MGLPAGKSVLAEAILESFQEQGATITADQISSYVNNHLPEESLKVTGFQQLPLIESIGLDFPVAVR